MFGRLLSLHPDVEGWEELVDKYWVPSDLEPFAEYFALFEQEHPTLRGGFGIGFERLIGFLLGSNDILNTVTHRPV